MWVWVWLYFFLRGLSLIKVKGVLVKSNLGDSKKERSAIFDLKGLTLPKVEKASRKILIFLIFLKW